MKLQDLKKGAKVRAVQQIVATLDDIVIAKKGDVGTIVTPSNNVDRWPTVQFDKGASIVFDDEVESA